MPPAFFQWATQLTEPPQPRRRPYRSYRALWLSIAELARTGRGAVSIAPIGDSAGGEPMWSVTVDPGAARASVFVIAGLHAMEHVGPATALALLERACGGAAAWRDVRLIVVPVANPDGFRRVETMLARGSRSFSRKNGRGVDLNRNFAIGWDDDYYLNRWLRPVFSPGDGPLSEPETRAIDRLIANERPGAAVSLHAFGEQIYWPYAGSAEPPPHAERLAQLAQQMAAAQPHRRYATMQLGRRFRAFKACGAEIDHFYARYGALSFLIEIGAGPRLTRPSTLLSAYRWFTPPDDLLERDIANVLPALDALASSL